MGAAIHLDEVEPLALLADQAAVGLVVVEVAEAAALAQPQEGAVLEPARTCGSVDHRAREEDLLAQVAARVLGDQQVLLAQQLLEDRARREVLARLDAGEEPLRHRAHLVIDDELLEALAALEVEHARAGHAVDPGQGGQGGAHGGLQPGLGVEQLGVAQGDVGLANLPQAARLGRVVREEVHGRCFFRRAHHLGAVEVLAVELVRPSVRDALHAEAMALRADARWMTRARYGVMFHWTKRTAPRSGPSRSYADAVEAFDVVRFADQVVTYKLGDADMIVGYHPVGAELALTIGGKPSSAKLRTW